MITYLRRYIFVLSYVFICFSVSCEANDIDFSIKKVVESADVYRHTYTDKATLHLYQGNGRFGSAFALSGLNASPAQANNDIYGKTEFMHIEHYVRGEYNSDYLSPVLRMYWYNTLAISSYTQHQSFYDGTLTTSFKDKDCPIKIESWFDEVNRDLACFIISIGNNMPHDVAVDPGKIIRLHYGQVVSQTINIDSVNGGWKFTLECLGKKCFFFVKTNAQGQIKDDKLFLSLKKGENNIQISYRENINVPILKSRQRTAEWWHSKWENTGCIKFSDIKTQQMWVRSMALLLSTFNNEKLGLAPPTGLTGNSWSFPFPQDLSYIAPALLSTGNMGIIKSWIEYFADRLDGMKAYTKRLIKVDGVMLPWVFPYGSFIGYHDPLPPNQCYYEIHNSGYLARMANETSLFVNDPSWTKKYAIPLIKETAIFYKSICKKDSDGLWHLFVTPSMGQDEMGGANQKDYLDALYSTKYCFEQAIAYGLDNDKQYEHILKDGLAFQTLKSDKGYYYSCQGRGTKDFGNQKHPVQLNELAYLPTERNPSKEALAAYYSRYNITRDAKRPFFWGWTMGEYLLAGSRVGDAKEWSKDWDNMQKSENVDSDFIQIYESSKNYGMSFFNTTAGLMIQTLVNNIVCDWYNKLEVTKCFPWKGDIYFKNLYSKLGIKVSGYIINKNVHLTMHAWKDTSFSFHGEHLIMKKGEILYRKFYL